jgi:hypothetical protein
MPAAGMHSERSALIASSMWKPEVAMSSMMRVAPMGLAIMSSGGSLRNSFGCETPLIGRSCHTWR